MENVWLDTTFTRWEGSARKDGSGISSSSFPSDDFRTWPRALLDGCLSTTLVVLSSLLTITSMIKYIIECILYHLQNCRSLHIFELPSKSFGKSFPSASSTLFYAASHFRKALKSITIPMIPLILPPMMKLWPLEESYLLPDDLLCQPISYVMVSLPLFFFFHFSDSAHQLIYDLLLCSSISFISIVRAS